MGTPEGIELKNDAKLFPLEKILTISAGDYLNITRSNTNYDLVGVHNGSGVCDFEIAIHNFRISVPHGAEVVVDYRVAMAESESPSVYFVISGTALVPKK